MRIGFIGLGIMGSRMAANLARAGFELTVYNRTKDRAEPVLALGAKWAGSPAEAARSSDVVVTMLSTPEAVRGVALGEEGVLKAMTGGSLWMDCSTVNPSFSREMARHAQAAGVRFLDAPVGGTKGPAGQGTLI
ncbi:MAG: NAD(P)-dependent oxidoreductase, partial [Rhodothermales bacterium]|nr:NAD(P)-dependent oxidoreductase [Rhodothermales bacterium]